MIKLLASNMAEVTAEQPRNWGDAPCETQMLIRLVVGLGMTAIVGLLALRRVGWLAKLTLSGQQVSGRTDDVGDADVDADRPRCSASASC